MSLSIKQAKFVESYLINNNSKESALNAGYSAKSAPAIGCQLLKNERVLKEIDLQINQGDFIAITGPSGSGKSTIMHLIGALGLAKK